MNLSLVYFLIYLAIVIVIGVWSFRKETEEGFMLAERKVQGFQVAATMSASFFDGAILSIYIAYIYQFGLSAIWFFVGLALGFLFLRKYAGKIKQIVIMLLMSVIVAAFLLGKTSIPSSEINLGAAGAGNIISFFILGVIGIMVAPDLWQRMFATKDEKNLRKGLSYSAITLLLLALIISVVGIATKQFFPNIVPEDALITGFSHLLPFGLKELGTVLLFAVTLSSSDTVTFVVSSIITRDLKNYTAKYSTESMKRLARFFMCLFVVLAVIIGIVYQNILALGFSLGSLYLALFPVVFGSLYWRLKEKAVFWSLMSALLTVVILFLGNYLNPQTAIISLPVALISLIIFQKIYKKKTEYALSGR